MLSLRHLKNKLFGNWSWCYFWTIRLEPDVQTTSSKTLSYSCIDILSLTGPLSQHPSFCRWAFPSHVTSMSHLSGHQLFRCTFHGLGGLSLWFWGIGDGQKAQDHQQCSNQSPWCPKMMKIQSFWGSIFDDFRFRVDNFHYWKLDWPSIRYLWRSKSATTLKGMVSDRPTVAVVGEVNCTALAQANWDRTLSNKPLKINKPKTWLVGRTPVPRNLPTWHFTDFPTFFHNGQLVKL